MAAPGAVGLHDRSQLVLHGPWVPHHPLPVSNQRPQPWLLPLLVGLAIDVPTKTGRALVNPFIFLTTFVACCPRPWPGRAGAAGANRRSR